MRQPPPAALPILLLLASSVAAGVAQEPSPPPFYAIRDARVHTVSGPTLERATVLVAEGLIEAVGTDLEIPAEFRVIESNGLALFPGLVDGLTDLGLQRREAETGNRPTVATVVAGPEDRPRTTPWATVLDRFDGDDDRFETWRRAGFTTVVTAPTEGLFAGQATVLDLATGDPSRDVVSPAVAQRVNFTTSGLRSFPGSLMGVLSYVGQVLSDTRHAIDVEAAYAASPRGRERPPYDRTLDSLAEALDGGTPFLLPADSPREIDRALRLAESYGLRPLLYGGQGAYDRVGRLAEGAVPLLIDLDWPEEDKNRDPQADVPFRTLYHRQMAPATPGRLEEGGVPFAFTSGGATPDEALAGVREAVDAGLAEAAALRALTLEAARIFGLDDRLGSIEAGKIANLVLASDLPWAEGSEIEAVFVDGLYFPRRTSEEEEPPIQDVSGTWTLTVETPAGRQEASARLEMESDGTVRGETESELGTSSVRSGRMAGRLLTFETSETFFDRPMDVSYTLEVDGESLDGSVSAGSVSVRVVGTRIAAGESLTAASTGSEERPEPDVTRQELEEAMGLYHGPVSDYDVVAITNATVWTVTGDTLPNGTVLVRDGKIAAVGPDVEIPRRAEVIDGGGGHLIPGIIDAHSHIAVEGGVNEGTLAVTSMVDVGDVLDPTDVAIYRALAGGVTTANILHGSANPIGGRNAVIKLRWGRDAEGLKLEGAPPGIKFALGENPKRSRSFGNLPPRYPATRMGVMDVIRQAFTEAREYRKEWQQYEAARRRGEEPLPPRRDFELEALVEILEGERMVHAHCYRADEILQLLRIAEEQGFRIATLQHVLEGYKVADEIAAHGAGASTFSDWWGYKMEAYDAIPYNAALMTERGVLVSINSDSGEEMRHLNQEAAKSIKWGGLDEVEALKLVTYNPALQLGIAERVGSIEVGKDADLVLYDGHPLSVLSVVQKTFVDGDLYFDLEADRVRQAKIDGIKDRLLGRDTAEADNDETEPTGPAVETTPWGMQ